MDVFGEFKSEKMDPGLYDFAKFKAQTSCFKGLQQKNYLHGMNDLEIMDVGNLKVIRGVQGEFLSLPRICGWSKVVQNQQLIKQ